MASARGQPIHSFTCVSDDSLQLALVSKAGACGPQAVKAKPCGQKKRGPCSRPKKEGSGPHHPTFFGLDGQPPLIGAGLAGCMRNPSKEGKPMRTDVYQKITDQIVRELAPPVSCIFAKFSWATSRVPSATVLFRRDHQAHI